MYLKFGHKSITLSKKFTPIFSYKGHSTIKCFSSSISPLEQFVHFLSDLIYERLLKKRIFQYHNIFEYFVKSCQTRQGTQTSTDRWYFFDNLSCICSIIAVFHASNIHMDLHKAN
jgi:VanZ family protein